MKKVKLNLKQKLKNALVKAELVKQEQKSSLPVTEECKASNGLSALQEKMHKKLSGAQFRMINERLYTSNSRDAVKLFNTQPDLFDIYHQGFQSQVVEWPVNPVDVIIQELESKSPMTVVADMGCGEAKLASRLHRLMTVHSFDLVAANEFITAADIAHVHLKNKSCDVVVFCLSLMGTNLDDFIAEAYRILKVG